jgi:hypothetical protein
VKFAEYPGRNSRIHETSSHDSIHLRRARVLTATSGPVWLTPPDPLRCQLEERNRPKTAEDKAVWQICAANNGARSNAGKNALPTGLPELQQFTHLQPVCLATTVLFGVG